MPAGLLRSRGVVHVPRCQVMGGTAPSYGHGAAFMGGCSMLGRLRYTAAMAPRSTTFSRLNCSARSLGRSWLFVVGSQLATSQPSGHQWMIHLRHSLPSISLNQASLPGVNCARAA